MIAVREKMPLPVAMSTTREEEEEEEEHGEGADDAVAAAATEAVMTSTTGDQNKERQQQQQLQQQQSLEQIVEQRVMQNVQIQRVLQRQKRRGGQQQQSHSSGSGSTRPASAASPTPCDEGIYDSLLAESPAAFNDHDPEDDGDYVSLTQSRTNWQPSQLLEDVFHEEESNDGDSPVASAAPSSASTSSCGKISVSRSLSCPGRSRVARKKSLKDAREAEFGPSADGFGVGVRVGVGGESVASRIHRMLNQLGSADNWPNWMMHIRSLSPPDHQRRSGGGGGVKSVDNRTAAANAASLVVAAAAAAASAASGAANAADAADAAASPCLPSVWLQMQSEHLAVASSQSKKSGSLPRTFQVTKNKNQR